MTPFRSLRATMLEDLRDFLSLKIPERVVWTVLVGVGVLSLPFLLLFGLPLYLLGRIAVWATTHVVRKLR